MSMQLNKGFSLVELLAVIVIIAALAAVGTTRMFPHTTMALQAGRDLLLAAFMVAQQQAMAQNDAVSLITTATLIDVRRDANGDGNFDNSESVRVAGTQYPVSLEGGATLSSTNLLFTRLGKTTATNISVSLNGEAVAVTVTGTGYAY